LIELFTQQYAQFVTLMLPVLAAVR